MSFSVRFLLALAAENGVTILVRTPDGSAASAPTTADEDWTCTVCGRLGPWTDDYQWYGSLSDIDGGSPLDEHKPGPIVLVCSDPCRDRADALGLTDKNPGRDTTPEAE